MSSDNNVTLIGNLVDDPELRFTPSGIALANIRLAVNKRWKGQNDEWQEETSFFGGTLWREQAEQAAESLTKGTRVIVVGRLQQQTWEDDKGNQRSKVEVQIDEIGPSLRWATAQVHRAGRNDYQSGGKSDHRPPSPNIRDDYGPDEAPF